MNRDLVVSALEEAIRNAPAVQAVVEGTDWLGAEARRYLENRELAGPVREALKRQAEFADGAGFVIHAESAWSGLDADVAATALVERGRAEGSAESAYSWLESLLKKDSAEGLSVFTVWGVEISSRIDFAEGISLVPFHELPNSRAKRFFIEPPEGSFREHLGLECAPGTDSPESGESP